MIIDVDLVRCSSLLYICTSANLLEEHTDDRHHGQSAVGKLGRQLLGLLLRIRRSQDLEPIVTGSAALVVIEATAELDKAKVRSDLSPSCHWHLRDCRKPIRDVSELKASRWRQESRPCWFKKFSSKLTRKVLTERYPTLRR